MKTITLTQIEAGGIQDYIFGSNNLRQNIGASELVARSTTQWVAETLDTALGRDKHNIQWVEEEGQLIFLPARTITDNTTQAEVIYAGGGNALILFKGASDEHAIEFTKALTTKGVQEARGLRLVVDHIPFTWADDAPADQALSKVHTKLRRQMLDRKSERPPDTPLSGLGVTAACDFTGMPAVGRDQRNLISQEVRHKLDAHNPAQKRLNTLLPQVGGGKYSYDFVYEFDMFGERNESSFIAVIHADGNGMGKRFENIADEHPDPKDNANYVIQLRKLSQAVKDKASTALNAAVNLLIESRKRGPDGNDYFGDIVPVPKKGKQEYLPFRPIVFGGDDTTFVCEGRLGLALANKFLQSIAEGELPGAKEGQEGFPLYARAGVAVVKSHYPFSRAYELAEALAKSAKDNISVLMDGEKGSVIDWHFSTSGIIVPLDQLREQEYVAKNGHSLLMRPVWVDTDQKSKPNTYWRSWQNFNYVTSVFKGISRNPDENKAWADRRNKIMGLRVALRDGGETVEQFRESYEQELLPKILESATDNIQDDTPNTMRRSGWQGKNCGYFDAIEAIDFYEPLHSRENGQ